MIFGIIGYGRFGKLWAKALLPFGKVHVYDKNQVLPIENPAIKVASLQEVAEADIIFILVPISAFEESCLTLKNFVNPTALIVDACSVKAYPAKIMQTVFNPHQPLLASHPLFGPDSIKKTGGFTNHKIVVCSLQGDVDKKNSLLTIFKTMGLHIFTTTPIEHDQQMACSQGLVHFLGRGLAELNIKEQEIATPDFQALLNINHTVMNDSWQLFLDMHRYNPYTQNIRQKLIDALVSLDKQI